MKKLMIMLAMALLPIPIQRAEATSYPVLYVAPNGSSAIGCGTSPGNPCNSISAAVDYAIGYGTTTIKVAKGNYTDNTYISVSLPSPHTGPLSIEGGWNADFTVQTQDPSLTRITSPSDSAIFAISLATLEVVDLRLAYLTLRATAIGQKKGIEAWVSGATFSLALEHCRLTSYHGEAVSLYGQAVSSLSFTLEDSTIEGTVPDPASAVWLGGGINTTITNNTTANLTLSRNHIINNQAYEGGGLYLWVGDNSSSLTATLENNIIAGNQATGMGGGVFIVTAGNGTSNITMTNNTLAGNSTPIYGTGMYLAATDTSVQDITLTNTIVWQPGTDIYTSRIGGLNSLTITASYSLVGEVDTTQGSASYVDNGGNLSSNPLLTQSYHLSATSPARDKGRCGTLIPLTFPPNPVVYFYYRVAPYDDIDGDARPGYNTILGCDIGADEYRFPWPLYNPAIQKK